jgi:hypothetical protein
LDHVPDLPLMAAIQIISACIGWETRKGLISNLALQLPRPIVNLLVALLVIANMINIAADLAAMGAALRLVFGPEVLYAIAFGLTCLVAEVFIPYMPFLEADAAGLLGGDHFAFSPAIRGMTWSATLSAIWRYSWPLPW